MVTVHIITHSHQDAGWRKTVDEYYTGGNFNKDGADVHTILEGVIDELTKDTKRKFTIVDIKYFTMWYNHANSDKKKIVKDLIKNG